MNFSYILPNPLTLALSPIWGEGWGEGHPAGDEQTLAREPDMINEVKKGLR